MRISDLSSDVCSSDLASGRATTAVAPACTAAGMKSSPFTRAPWKAPNTVPGATFRLSIAKPDTGTSSDAPASSEECRVGKEWDSTWRVWWSPKHENKKHNTKNKTQEEA